MSKIQLDKYESQVKSSEVRRWISSNLANYLKENDENQGEIEHILDYLSARKKYCEERSKNFKIKKMSYAQAKELAEKWVERLKKQAEYVVETEEDTELTLDLGEGMRLVKLIGKSAFQREGKLMSHCVGSYYDKKDLEIYSVRDIKNNPHCTIEIRKNRGNKGDINQIKGKGNGSIHPRYISQVIKVLKHFGMTVRDSELSNLGYDLLSDNLMKLVQDNFNGIKTITFGGKVYFYRYSKLIRK